MLNCSTTLNNNHKENTHHVIKKLIFLHLLRDLLTIVTDRAQGQLPE